MMYALKVDLGRENVAVRQVNGGFLPTYQPVNNWKRLVVPGYVFIPDNTDGAVEVPENEWKIIEAVSDPRISTWNPETGTIIDGPLSDLEITKVDQQQSAVLIRAVLLGSPQNYWLKVWIGTEPPEEPEEPADDTEESQGKKGKGDKKMAGEKVNYTEEQMQEAVKMAEEKGIRAAADELGIPWQTVTSWVRKSDPNRPTVRRPKKQKTADEAPAPKGKPGRKPKKQPAEQPEAPAPAPSADLVALKSENAVLREKVAKLEAQVVKLQKAIQELLV